VHFAPKGRAQSAFSAFWLLAELARGVWWTGFPWGAGGYARVQGPLAALARWVGVYGVGAVAAALAMFAGAGTHVRSAQPRRLALVLLLGAVA
jgi:apolipoprotein N-acyltransferase